MTFELIKRRDIDHRLFEISPFDPLDAEVEARRWGGQLSKIRVHPCIRLIRMDTIKSYC